MATTTAVLSGQTLLVFLSDGRGGAGSSALVERPLVALGLGGTARTTILKHVQTSFMRYFDAACALRYRAGLNTL